MTDYGPSPLYTVYSTYVFFNALWEHEVARIREICAEEHVRPSSWKDVVVLDSSQPVHLEPLSKSEMDKLFDELESGSSYPGHTRVASHVQEDDSSE